MKKEAENMSREALHKILKEKDNALVKMKLELKIEASLETVRAVALLMKKREDMLQICSTIAKQLALLDVKEIRNVQTALFKEEKGTYMNYEYYAKHDKTFITETFYTDHEIQSAFAEKMLKGNGESMEAHLKGDEVKDWLAYQKTTNVFIDDYLETASSVNYYWFSLGPVALGTSAYEPLKKKDIALFKRFLKVFELSYRRYLDIEKAETQVRESQIQLALERARTQSMTMQRSSELDDTLRVFHEQVLLLGLPSAFSFLWLPDEKKDRHIFWAAWAENNPTAFRSKAINYPLDRDEPATKQCLIDWKGNDPVVSYRVQPESVKDYFAAWSELITGVEELKPENFSGGLYYVEAFMKYGCFGVIVKNPLSEEHRNILSRFAIEFERAYTRFLDLKKAESQVREAQVETTLEKVRSRSLSMHNSSEILEVVKTVFEKLSELSIELNTAFIIIFNEGSRDTEWWLVNKDKGEYSRILVPYADLLIFRELFESRERGETLFSKTYYDNDKFELFHYLFTQTDFKYAPAERQKYIFDMPSVSTSTAMTNKIAIQITRHYASPFSEEDNEIVKRFAMVFDQSYTRFLDLQKAEAQAREAQIEAALERVRSRTMGMQKSDELKDVIQDVYDQFVQLNIPIEHTGFIMDYKQREDMHIWLADRHMVPYEITIPYFDCAHWNSFNKAKKNGADFFANTLGFEEKNRFYEDLFKLIPGIPDETKEYYSSCPGLAVSTVLMDNVGLYIENFSGLPYSDEENATLMRFGKVFQQTYTRFNDLQKAEAQAREAQIEVSLERVRSRTLAMQKSDELAETAAVVFRQLISLGIEPNRLYITLIKDNTGDMEFWITDEDGTGLGNKYSGNAHRNISFLRMYKGWEAHEKSLFIDMEGDELSAYFDHLESLGVPVKHQLEQTRRVQYIAYFSRGFIGMASPDEQPAETVSLLERFATVFNLTYARFNDLKVAEHHAEQAVTDLQKLKDEKKRTEDALTELQSTQKQLIQAEKMASLGELTAGIAHEIQNPLNFVNNFSDVNKELLMEMKEEIDKGNMDEVKAMANDIIDNEEKINHHGKRADAIVKGMLQHSRSSATAKELTDINQLADEYLRLAYHGLRAKNKAFNATMKTDFDSSIGQVTIIPQDIARVLLNVINNAFYAVNEKKINSEINYQPTVSVSTKKANDKIEIRIADNGNGIPQSISNKIFQPFFTTKPTGHGTGLGLSLSYDIIKAHGGEISMETEEGCGTEFVVVLPIV